MTIELRADDGTWVEKGISVLVIEGTQIATIDAFLEPGLVPRFRAEVVR